MKLKFAFAALLAASSFSAMAADQTVTISTGAATNFYGITTPTEGLLDGGSDTISFVGLDEGTYSVKLSFSSLDASITSATLNGVTGFLHTDSISFGSFKYTSLSPFTLVLNGTLDAGATAAAYSGQINVTAVPEPETYAMMLGGLGLVGFMARRRKSKAA